MTDKPDLRSVMEHYGCEINSQRREISVKCPVHDEDRASCSVNLDEGLWSCHACGAGGDAYTLIMTKESCDFPAAQRLAEEKLGFSGGGVSQPARRSGAGVPRKSGPGFRPVYRNSPVRRRPLSSS